MDASKKIRKEVFSLIRKFRDKTLSKKEFTRIAEILLYNTPYKNRIVQPVKKEQLGIVVQDKLEEEGTIGFFSENSTSITFDFSKIIGTDFGKFLNSVGHERTHFTQKSIEKAQLDNPNLTLSQEAQEIVDSYQYADVQHNLSRLYSMFDMNIRDLINGTKEHPTTAHEKQDAMETIDHMAYSQLPYEENARDCGFEFSREMLDALIQDELCDDKTKIYLEQCKENLAREWQKEINKRNSNSYTYLRKNTFEMLKLIDEMSIEKLSHINFPNSVVKQQIADMKLFNLRKQNVDKITYLKAIATFGSIKKNNRASIAYMKDCNPKQLALDAIERGDFNPAQILGNLNFLLPGDPIMLSEQELTDTLLNWIKNNEYKKVNEVFECLENGVGFSNVSGFIMCDENESAQQAVKNIRDNYEVFDKISRQFQRIKSFEDLDVKQMTEEDLILFENRFDIGMLCKYLDSETDYEMFDEVISIEKVEKIYEEIKERKNQPVQLQETIENTNSKEQEVPIINQENQPNEQDSGNDITY